jgi:protocatechuate 3,4-dioxygenase beta subunit
MWKVLVAATLILGTAAILLLVGRREARQLVARSASEGPREPVEDRAAPDARTSIAAGDVAVEESLEPVGCVLEVALVSAAGADLIAGRGVTLRVGDLGSSRGDSRTLEGVTDARGLCRFEAPDVLDLRRVLVGSAPESPGVTRWLYESLALPGEVKRVEIEVEGGVALSGRVVDEGGDPVPGARVVAWSGTSFDPSQDPERSVDADGDGRFALEHLGRPFAIVARADGRACSIGLRGELAPGARVGGDLELVLAAEWRVSGRVVGSRGEPVAAELSVREHGTTSSAFATAVAGVATFRPAHADATTDAEGRFELGPLPYQACNVRLLSEVYGERYLSLPLEPGPWTIRLEDGVVLRGAVSDAAGTPVAGARVGLDGDGISSRRTRTGADGTFEIRGLPELESTYLSVAAAGFEPWLREGIELSAQAPPPWIEARLSPGLPMAGRVVDAVGRPAIGVRLVLEGERSYERHYSTDEPATVEHLVDRGQTTTDRDGRFRFEDLYPGEFALRVFPRGERQAYAESRARAGATDLELRLDPADFERVVLRGRVRDAVAGTPVAGTPVTGFVLTAMLETAEGASGVQREVRDPEGAFRLGLPREVRMYLQVQAPGYATWTEPMRGRGEGEHEYDVRLVRERSLELRFHEADGTPAGGSLSVFDESGARLRIGAHGLRSSEVRLEDGVVRGLGLPAGPLRLVLRPGRGREAEEFLLDLRADPGPVVELFLAPRAVEPEPFEVEFTVLTADRDVDVEALTALLRDSLGGVRLDGCAPLAAPCSITCFAADGASLLQGRMEPTPEGCRVDWRDVARRSETEEVLPPELGCMVSRRVPGLARRVRLEAQGHAVRELTLDPALPNGGLPLLVLLRR